MKEILVYIQVADATNSPEDRDTLPEIQIIIDNEHPSRSRTIGIEVLTRAIISAAENLSEGRSADVFLKVRLGRAVELNSPGSNQRKRRTTTTTEGGVR